ncbi:hypothetical protein [Kribbella monticola]|uniref:hypothetical protein n=1 Tax=Kribbella monticola TaxID=2185285 RepID=UPI0018E594ED|nr:hypothetical protein [Kribbella monticola]
MTTTAEAHRHRWTVESAHQVSEGLVVYQRCECGRRRITSTPAYPVAYPELAIIDA